MRRVIRRRIRHTEDGLDLAADVNADISINVGRRPVGEDDDAEREQPERPATSEANDQEGSQA